MNKFIAVEAKNKKNFLFSLPTATTRTRHRVKGIRSRKEKVSVTEQKNYFPYSFALRNCNRNKKGRKILPN